MHTSTVLATVRANASKPIPLKSEHLDKDKLESARLSGTFFPDRLEMWSPLTSQRMSFGIEDHFVEIQSFWRSKEQVKVFEGFG
jgi:hypothetical protein